MVTDQKQKILESAIQFYINSGDFNGLGTASFKRITEIAAIKELISEGSLDLVRGDRHPNPHIKAHPAEPIALQLKKIDASGIEGCLYPTSKLLKERNAGAGEAAPYTRALKEGAPQLSFRVFDLRALEWYRNDPRFDFDVDDIHGRILQKAGTQIENRNSVFDGLEFLQFGFAYNKEMHRAIAVFIRDLHDLPEEQQIAIQKHELSGAYELHPDFYRTQIIGDFPERISIYDAFLQEKIEINQLCALIGKPNLFLTEHRDLKRPQGFGILIRPTKKEFREFSLILDQLLSDDINIEFFKGDIETSRKLTDELGNRLTQAKGSIQLLEEWLSKKFTSREPEEPSNMLKNIRAVRRTRQKPAHKLEENEFDQKYIKNQRELIIKAFSAVRTLRMILENHPDAIGHEISSYLRDGKVWTM